MHKKMPITFPLPFSTIFPRILGNISVSGQTAVSKGDKEISGVFFFFFSKGKNYKEGRWNFKREFTQAVLPCSLFQSRSLLWMSAVDQGQNFILKNGWSLKAAHKFHNSERWTQSVTLTVSYKHYVTSIMTSMELGQCLFFFLFWGEVCKMGRKLRVKHRRSRHFVPKWFKSLKRPLDDPRDQIFSEGNNK